MLRPCVALALSLGLLAAAPLAAPEPDRLHLPLGDPARKVRDVPVVLDAIVDTRTGADLAPEDLVARLVPVKLLVVGERHTAIDAHRVEARLIAMLARGGRHVVVGLEMYPYTEQGWLDAWNQGLVTEAGFLHLSHWYRYWGFPWQYYRDVFLTARDHDARLVAINAPLEVVRAVHDKGIGHLTAEEAAHIPEHVALDNPEQLALVKASLAGGDAIHGGGTEEGWKRLVSAQATWDATMAFNAVKALAEVGDDPQAIVVVLAGAGHVEYGLGIQRQAAQWYKDPVATLIPVEAGGGDGARSVRASYADFVWGIPAEEYPAYPTLGVSLGGAMNVLGVDAGSPGANAGIRTGDRLVSIDGLPVDDAEAFYAVMAAKRWGDTASLAVKRGGTIVTLRAAFRRTPPPAIVARRQP